MISKCKNFFNVPFVTWLFSRQMQFTIKFASIKYSHQLSNILWLIVTKKLHQFIKTIFPHMVTCKFCIIITVNLNKKVSHNNREWEWTVWILYLKTHNIIIHNNPKFHYPISIPLLHLNITQTYNHNKIVIASYQKIR